MQGVKSIELIDYRIPPIIERIRQLCDNRAIIMNTWHRGGTLKYRGYRPPDCTVGAPKSMHRFGKAVDFDVKGLSAEYVRWIIRSNHEELLRLGLTRIEKLVGWVHIDTKHTGLNYIYEFNP
jgi:hypothetical protein